MPLLPFSDPTISKLPAAHFNDRYCTVCVARTAPYARPNSCSEQGKSHVAVAVNVWLETVYTCLLLSVQQTCVASLFSLIMFHVRHTHTNIHPIQPKSGSVLATAENTFKVAVSTNLHTKELTFVLQCYPMKIGTKCIAFKNMI